MSHVGTLGGDLPALDQALCKLVSAGRPWQIVYEAGPNGVVIYRHLVSKGMTVSAIAPSSIPRIPGDRIKTDGRDALQLAQLARNGDHTPILVPAAGAEAVRDVTRARAYKLFDDFYILRLICGLFLIPHLYAKFYVPAALGFFVAAGFKPPRFWMYLAGVIEFFLAIGLIFGIFVTIIAALAAIHLLVAAVGVYRVTGKYLWNIGGYEFCLFWAICCWIVAMHAYYAGGIWN